MPSLLMMFYLIAMIIFIVFSTKVALISILPGYLMVPIVLPGVQNSTNNA